MKKNVCFNINNRIDFIKEAVKGIDGVTVKSFDTLLVKFAKKEKVYNIIRGLRTNTDFEYELQMSYANSSLDKDIDTLFLMPCLKNAFVSSSIVRELIRFDGDFTHLVPESIIEKINQKVKEQCM